MGEIHAFTPGHIHKIGHYVASYVLIFALLQQNLLSINILPLEVVMMESRKVRGKKIMRKVIRMK